MLWKCHDACAQVERDYAEYVSFPLPHFFFVFVRSPTFQLSLVHEQRLRQSTTLVV